MVNSLGYGKKRYFETPESMQNAAENYFKECIKADMPITLSGTAYNLGFKSIQSFYDYSEYGDDFKAVVDRIKLRCAWYYETRLTTSKNPSGAIFALKNFGWSDKQDINVNGNVTTSLATAIENGRKAVLKD